MVYAKPDKVVITFGVETNDKNPNTAKRANNDILVAAMEAIRKAGVDEDEIQTAQISIEPRWDYVNQKQQFAGYFVRNLFVVTINEAEKADAVIVAALDAGVNSLQGIDFQTSDLKKHREEARRLALLDAADKAQKMASVLDQKVGHPIDISEQYQGSPVFWSSWGNRGGGLMQVRAQAESADSEAPATVALGKLAIRANVNVTFLLKHSIPAE